MGAAIYMPITWKNMFWHQQTSLFNVGPAIQEGHYTTLKMADYRHDGVQDWNSGAAWRFVTDLVSDDSYSSLPGGASGEVWSAFYNNRVFTFPLDEYEFLGIDE